MPILANPRHETFAQELAAGHSTAEAYERAGYKPNYGNCIRLKGNERVIARVAELQSRGAARAEVTIASLVSELDETRSEALRLGQTSAAVAATMGKAKITGQIIDRTEIRETTEFDSMTEDELRTYIEKQLQELGLSVQSSSAWFT